MTRRIAVRFALASLFVLALAGTQLMAADAAIVGTWTLNAETPNGTLVYNLAVKQQDGALTATMDGGDQSPMTVHDVKADGDQASFVVDLNGESYTVKLTVKGDAVEGTWEGGDGSGAIKGSKKAA